MDSNDEQKLICKCPDVFVSLCILIDRRLSLHNLEMEFSMRQSLHTWQSPKTMALTANCIGASFIGNQPSDYRPQSKIPVSCL